MQKKVLGIDELSLIFAFTKNSSVKTASLRYETMGYLSGCCNFKKITKPAILIQQEMYKSLAMGYKSLKKLAQEISLDIDYRLHLRKKNY